MTSDIEPDTSDESPAVSVVSDDNNENEDCTGAGSSEIRPGTPGCPGWLLNIKARGRIPK